MKKENKKMAQERRALERKKAKQQALIKKILIIVVPILLVAAGFLALSISLKEDTSNESTVIDSTSDTTDITTDSTTSDTSDDTYSEDYDTSLPELSTDPDRVVEDGDTVNIDYVGTIDGVEFSGGSTGGAGADLTIGSGMYIDDFEQQLIGYKAGDTVEVVVTFPDDYGVDELNGKEAVFTTVINGIYDVY